MLSIPARCTHPLLAYTLIKLFEGLVRTMLTTHITSKESDLSNDDAGTNSNETTNHGNTDSVSPLVRMLCSELIEHASVLQSF